MKCRSFKSKGGAVLLLWEICAAIMIFHYYHYTSWIFKSPHDFVLISVSFCFGVFCFPVFGLLGDVVLGRYKTIKYSIVIMWLTVILNGIGEVFSHIYAEISKREWKQASKVIQLCGVIACGSLLVNSLHFGVDQLMNAPSRQITSFISWYTWCFYASDILSMLTLDCGCIDTISPAVLALIVTIGLCIDFLYNRELVKEPTCSNPLKLIYKVLKYAATNKYPHARSAFSYWDEKKSRINLSKSKYGGPFTHEEVEDVKSFFRMLWILLIGSLFTGFFIVHSATVTFEISRFRNNGLAKILYPDSSQPVSCHGCLLLRCLMQASSLFIVIAIPLFEFLIYPKCIRFPLLIVTRFNLGMLFLLLNTLSYLALDVAASITANNQNVTQLCFLDSKNAEFPEGNIFTLSYYWLYLPVPFNSLAYYLIFTSAMEFLCAQSPYSMKGLLVGLMYAFVILSIAMNMGLRHLYGLFPWHGSCTTLYYGVSTLITGLLFVMFIIMSRWYSKRRRRDNEDDDMPGEGTTFISTVDQGQDKLGQQ